MSVQGVNIGCNRIMVLGLPAYDPSGSTQDSDLEVEDSLISGSLQINLNNGSMAVQTDSLPRTHRANRSQ